MALILLDSNVLVHAAYPPSPLHAPAAWLVQEGLKEPGRYCIAPQNIVEFAAVITRSPRITVHLPVSEAVRIAALLYRSRTLKKIHPKRGTVSRSVQEGEALGITGAAWYDLFLAATMRDAGVRTIITENLRDFDRFPFVHARALSASNRLN